MNHIYYYIYTTIYATIYATPFGKRTRWSNHSTREAPNRAA